jgi:hypothetical protein
MLISVPISLFVFAAVWLRVVAWNLSRTTLAARQPEGALLWCRQLLIRAVLFERAVPPDVRPHVVHTGFLRAKQLPNGCAIIMPVAVQVSGLPARPHSFADHGIQKQRPTASLIV